MATLKDIAQEVGLSEASVSLVLRDKPNRLSPESRKLIWEAAKKLNYRPNQLAVSLAGRKSNTVGLVVPDVRNTFFADLTQGIEDTVCRSGRSLLLSSTGYDRQHTRECVENLASRQVDALILATASLQSGQEDSEELIALLQRLEIPLILVDQYASRHGFVSVSLDHSAGARMVTEHLLRLGHRRIACIAGPDYSTSSSARRQGFQEAMAAAGLPLREEDLFPGDYSAASGYAAAGEILKGDYTAIFAFNDMMAIGAYRRCRDQGLKIPEDLSIAGFDDIVFSSLLDVPLTTVQQSGYEIGVEAARQMVQAIDTGDCPSRHTYFEPRLQVRASTAPPKNTK